MKWIKSATPNLLSLLRLILIIPFMISLSKGATAIPFALAVLIVVSDFFDGYLARAWNVVSESGKIFDPVADKICTAAAAIGLVYYRGFPAWLVVLVVARDTGIMLAGLILIRYRKFVPVSDVVGKTAMVVLSGCLLVFLFDIESLKSLSVTLTVVTQVASALSYGRHFLRTMKKSNTVSGHS